MTTTIGIDPGGHYGLGAWVDGELAFTSDGCADVYEYEGRAKVLLRCCETLGIPISSAVVAVEDQFIGRNASSALVVARHATAWMVVARHLGALTAPLVAISTWGRRYSLPRKTKDKKKRAQEIVAQRLHQQVGPDLADAILIGLHHHLTRYERSEVVPPKALWWAMTSARR